MISCLVGRGWILPMLGSWRWRRRTCNVISIPSQTKTTKIGVHTLLSCESISSMQDTAATITKALNNMLSSHIIAKALKRGYLRDVIIERDNRPSEVQWRIQNISQIIPKCIVLFRTRIVDPIAFRQRRDIRLFLL